MTEKELKDNTVCDDWIDDIRLRIYERDKGKTYEQIRAERDLLMKELSKQYGFTFADGAKKANV